MTNFDFRTQNSVEVIRMTSAPNQTSILIEVNIWIDKKLEKKCEPSLYAFGDTMEIQELECVKAVGRARFKLFSVACLLPNNFVITSMGCLSQSN